MCASRPLHAPGHLLEPLQRRPRGGHALYELNINPDYDYTVVTHGATMGIHESQSRLFENLVGRSRAFVHYLYPTLKELFPAPAGRRLPPRRSGAPSTAPNRA